MSRTVKVRDYMTTQVITVNPETELLRAAHTLLKHEIAAAPVVDEGGNLVGILTERDCIRVVLGAGYHSEFGGRVVDYMSRNVKTIEADASIVDAAKLFCGQKFHRYPVMENGQLVGLLSRRDVMRALERLR